MPDDEMRDQAAYLDADPHGVIFASMVEAEVKAWEALAGYKFWMFGYHAARWVNYNQLLPRERRMASPFRSLVLFGRTRADERQSLLPSIDRQLALLEIEHEDR